MYLYHLNLHQVPVLLLNLLPIYEEPRNFQDDIYILTNHLYLYINYFPNLYHKYPNSNILKRAIGYKEVISYLNNEISLDDAKELIKKNTRHYAKRQYTWFNNQLDVTWFNQSNNILEEVNHFISGLNSK